MALGASGLETACFISDFRLQSSDFRLPPSGGLARSGLDDLSGAEAPRAHAHAFVAAVDDRLDRLEVRLEPARAHVVRVAMLPADNRPFSAQFTSLRHSDSTFLRRNADYTCRSMRPARAGAVTGERRRESVS